MKNTKKFCTEHNYFKVKLFKQYLKNFDIKISENDFQSRLVIFHKNVKDICKQNEQNQNMIQGLTKFTYLTDEEFQNNILSKPIKLQKKNTQGRRLQQQNIKKAFETLSKIPSKIDWSEKDIGTVVKNQKQCQSSYAYSAIGALEAQVSIKFGQQITLSEQEIIDCSKPFGNNGCQSGKPSQVYDYILQNGINLEQNYPQETDAQTCKSPTYKPVYTGMLGYIYPEPNIFSLMKFLQYGPVVVNHYAPPDFRNYLSGIYDSKSCQVVNRINHSGLLVGYNLNNNPPYFKLKNSWGYNWGMNGYYKMKIGNLSETNIGLCGVAFNGYNIFPIIK